MAKCYYCGRCLDRIPIGLDYAYYVLEAYRFHDNKGVDDEIRNKFLLFTLWNFTLLHQRRQHEESVGKALSAIVLEDAEELS